MSRAMLISGIARGLGAAFADAAVSAGHKVAGTVRTDDDAKLAAQRGIVPILFDLNEPAKAPAVVAAATAAIGPVEILVNNAGFGHEGILEESPLDALRRQLDVNVVGHVALIQAALPGMRAMRRGHIVNVTSMAGSVGLPGVAFYCGAKFAMEGISEALGKELRPLGIHVTAFAPGQFRTDWAGSSLERSPRSIADYDPVMDPLRSARQAKSGQQPGDPAKAATVLLSLLDLASPPARIFVGRDALALASQKIKRMQSEVTSAGQDLGRFTDHD